MSEVVQFPTHKVKPVTYKPEEVEIGEDNIIYLEFNEKVQEANFNVTVREVISSVIFGISGEEVPCKCAISDKPNKNDKYTFTSSFVMLKDYISPSNHHYHITTKHLEEAKKYFQLYSTGTLTWKELKKTKNRPNCYLITLTSELAYIELKNAYGDTADELIGYNFTIYNPKNKKETEEKNKDVLAWTDALEHNLEK